MLHSSTIFMNNRLHEREQAGNLRSLKIGRDGLIDFSSNDYLGFARSQELKQLIASELFNHPDYKNGATGSRLLTGNTAYAEELEQYIANFHGHKAGLLFNSGYDANVGLFSSVPQRGDTVITDELIHASIIDGVRLSNANRYTFRHNDLGSLEEKLKNSKGNVYVAIESVYSMDGDIAPLMDILALAEKYNANLIVDEAHAIGVFGKGIADNQAIQQRLFARVITFGKAMGVHGAVVLGSELLRKYLINFSRPFIYSTAASFHQLAAIKMAYLQLGQAAGGIAQLQENIKLFKHAIKTPSNSAIHCILMGSNQGAKDAAEALLQAGIDGRPVLSPTVAVGTERLRICLHSFNTAVEIALLTTTLNTLI